MEAQHVCGAALHDTLTAELEQYNKVSIFESYFNNLVLG